MPAGGISSHFRGGKASIVSRKGVATGKEGVEKIKTALSSSGVGRSVLGGGSVASIGKGVESASSSGSAAATTGNRQGKVDPASTPSTSNTATPQRRTRSTRTQLRTPLEGEVEAILADIDGIGKPPPSHAIPSGSFLASTFASQPAPPTAATPATATVATPSTLRSITPPPLPDPTSPYLLGTPPRSSSAYRRSATSSPSKRKAVQDVDLAASSSPSRRTDVVASSPTKRKARPSAEGVEGAASATEQRLASPTKVARTVPPLFEPVVSKSTMASATPTSKAAGRIEDGKEEEEEEDDDGLVLTPGRGMGTRITLGSPKAPLLPSSPLAHRSPTATLPRSVARRIMEDEDDESYLTPRSVRERPKGHVPQLLPMGPGSAIFRPGSSGSAATATPVSSRRRDAPASAATTAGDHSRSTPTVATRTTTPTAPPKLQPEPPLPEVRHELSADLPLPKHYASLLTLHMALEHALVVQLATCGASMASLEAEGDSDDATSDAEIGSSDATPRARSGKQRTVRLPNLVTYTAIRPLVERSGGRRLGPTELARLASVWTDFAASSSSSSSSSSVATGTAGMVEEVKGLGFIVSRTRTLDARTGRRVWDWGIGIELEVRRPPRAKTPPIQVGFGGVEGAPPTPCSSSGGGGSTVERPRFATPPPSSPRAGVAAARLQSTPTPSSPSKRRREQSNSAALPAAPSSPLAPSSPRASTKAREGMSFVAMWNNGIEVRKAEVGRRLRQRTARFHQLWLDERGITVPQLSPVEAQEDVKTSGRVAEPSTPSKATAAAATKDTDGIEQRGRATLGEGGLWTPSATRSGGRRAGGRTITFDRQNLDRDGLLDSDASADEADEVLAADDRGRRAMMAELQPTSKVRGKMPSSAAVEVKSDPSTAQASALPTNCIDSVAGWPIPHRGMVLYEWHPEFDCDSATIVRPVPLAELPPLRDAPPPTPSSGAATPTVAGGRYSRLAGSAASTPSRSGRAGGAGALYGLGIQDPPFTPQTNRIGGVATPSSSSSSSSSSLLLSGSGSGSGLSLKDRIRQKEEAKRSLLLAKSSTSLLSRATPGTPSSVASSSPSPASVVGGTPGTPSRSSMMATLQRRSVLSRLPEIAGIVYVIFTSGSSSSAAGGGGMTRTPTLPMADVVTRLSKSVKTTMSRSECRDAIDILRDEVKGFLDVVVVGGKEWVKMGRKEGAMWGLQEIRERIGEAIGRG